ncbi:MAG: hypothetical protein AB1705_26515, partial [Verrucomicrobiota bacterium]
MKPFLKFLIPALVLAVNSPAQDNNENQPQPGPDFRRQQGPGQPGQGPQGPQGPGPRGGFQGQGPEIRGNRGGGSFGGPTGEPMPDLFRQLGR